MTHACMLAMVVKIKVLTMDYIDRRPMTTDDDQSFTVFRE